jgi:diguanylate cyclase (GGDEF)-like protein
VLKGVADRLRSGFRTTDLVARWGGEEFLVLMSGLPPTEKPARKEACDKLNRVREDIGASPIPLRTGAVSRVTISAGVAIFRHESLLDTLPPEEHAAALFEIADRRLRASKREGRNRVTCVDGPCPHT